MTSFKEEMLTNFIPRIGIMIEKEKKHIKYLEEHKKYFPISLEYHIVDMIETSKKMLEHLEKRYQEYIDYVEKI